MRVIQREDCSEVIWRFGYAVRRAGATRAEAFALMRRLPHWNDRVARRKLEDPERLLSRLYASSAPDALDVIDPASWFDVPIPQREWLVPDWLPMRKASGLYGDGGVGKTTLAMQLAVSVAYGRPFLDHEVRAGRVYAFLAEDEEDDTHIAFDEIVRAYGLSQPVELDRMRIAPRAGFDNILMSFGRERSGCTKLFELLLADIVQFAPVLVILDTAADLFDGNENDRGQVRRFIQEVCFTIARKTGAAVLLCAHPSQAGLSRGDGTGGSTAWNNTLRARLYLEAEKDEGGEEIDPDVRLLTLKKSNKSRRGVQKTLRWKAGLFVVDENVRREAEFDAYDQKVVDEVRRAFERGEPFSKSHQAQDRYIVRWMNSEFRWSIPKAKGRLDRLLRCGLIVQVTYDKRTHKTGLCTPEQKAALETGGHEGANEKSAKMRNKRR